MAVKAKKAGENTQGQNTGIDPAAVADAPIAPTTAEPAADGVNEQDAEKDAKDVGASADPDIDADDIDPSLEGLMLDLAAIDLEPEIGPFEADLGWACAKLKIDRDDVLDHAVYGDRVVVVTKSGQKLVAA